MKIKYKADEGKTQIINDVAIGTVFSGRIRYFDGSATVTVDGVFLRGRATVISLDFEGYEWNMYDAPVLTKNYKVLDVELVVKG